MKTKILVVEDDPHILLGLEEVLKSDGFEVAVCNRGDRAMEAVARHRPALLVLDVMLPGLSGYDICKQLRAKKCATRRADAHGQRPGDRQGNGPGTGRRRLCDQTVRLARATRANPCSATTHQCE